ncbi:MAG: phosphoribosylanthranilate isomerase [Candidatus Bathyarchaeia archaeon]
MKVKICGITREEDLTSAVKAGVDALGFIVNIPFSQRNLSLEKAKKLIKKAPIFIDTVAVIKPKTIKELTKIAKNLKPKCLQIYGNAIPLKELKKLELPIIKPIKADEKTIFKEIKEAYGFNAVLIDSFSLNKLGGTGEPHNWSLSRKVRDKIYPKPLILAGGLTLNNVQKAIKIVKPYAVDVSTGVEVKPGIKSYKKMVEFVKKAKELKI